MFKPVLIVTIALLLVKQLSAQNNLFYENLTLTEAMNTAMIELRFYPAKLKDSGQTLFFPIDLKATEKTRTEWKKHIDGVIHWEIETTEPIYVNYNDLLIERKNGFWLMEPGDRVRIVSTNSELIFSGAGHKKYELQYKLDSLVRGLTSPKNSRDFKTESIADYFDWLNYLKSKMTLGVKLIELYRQDISETSYNILKDRFVTENIANLCTKFGALKSYIKSSTGTNETLCSLYDTAYSQYVNVWTEQMSDKESYYLPLMEHAINRQFMFDDLKAPSKEQLNVIIYKHAINNLHGAKREQFIVNHFPEQLMMEVGFTPEIKQLLEEYYNEKQFSENKKWMKEQEIKIRRQKLYSHAPDFYLVDIKGSKISKEQIKGKFAILLFRTYESDACTKLSKLLQKAQETFVNNKNVVLLNIYLDNKENLPQQKHLLNTGNTLSGFSYYSVSNKESKDLIEEYALTTFPTLFVMGPDGNLIEQAPHADQVLENGGRLIEFLQKQLAFSKDGPYVLYTKDSAKAWYVNNNMAYDVPLDKKKARTVFVQSDTDLTFPVTLKKSMKAEPCVFTRPSRLFVVSDIEGNFDSFRKLLQSNHIIDQNFNWTFEDGHLVFLGDMFDRGLQVTECLWLLYSLEEKAKVSGGYVHFILGNHELMNLQGDHRYVKSKYNSNAGLIGKTLTQLYGEDSELGRWLRTKNIIERIGDLLFVHGGISHPVWRMPLGISQINHLTRPFYSRKIDSANKNLIILYGNKRTGHEKSYSSPFWFRGYYGDIDNPNEIPTSNQIDSSLNKFGATRIITGHTIVADTVSLHYGGKVINVDTRHAEGQSEALLIINNEFYRVNLEGIRRKLEFLRFIEK